MRKLYRKLKAKIAKLKLALYLLPFLTVLLMAGCGAIVRDKRVYLAEVSWHESMHTRAGAELVRLASTRTGTECEALADLGLTLVAHASWHAQAERALIDTSTKTSLPPVPPVPAVATVCGGAQ